MLSSCFRDDLTTRLLEIPKDIEAAELTLFKASQAFAQAKTALECREADLILCGVDGRNETERKARLHVGTLSAQEAFAVAAGDRDRAAMALRVLQNEFSALRSIARLLVGTE